jgi:hypothetical protein
MKKNINILEKTTGLVQAPVKITHFTVVEMSGIPLSVLHSNTTGTYTACFISDNDPLETSKCANSKYCK